MRLEPEESGEYILRRMEKATKLEKEKQDLIDYLKENIKEQEHKKTTSDFGLDIVYTKGKIKAYQEILYKIEKR